MVLALLLAFAAAAAAAEQGTEQNPYKGQGPFKAWVSNGKWLMRATEVRLIKDLPSFQALPWTSRLAEKEDQVFSYYEKNVFAEKKGKMVVLVRLEMKIPGQALETYETQVENGRIQVRLPG